MPLLNVVADVGIAAMDHDLDAVAAAALVRVAHEPDVAGGHGVHGRRHGFFRRISS